jgi:putative ABC transport system permease protein
MGAQGIGHFSIQHFYFADRDRRHCYKQLHFVQSRNLGYTKNNLLSFERQGKLSESLQSFLAEAKNITGVVTGSSSSESVTNIRSTSSGHTWEGRLSDAAEIRFTGLNVNYDFIETLGIEMKEGRPFSRDFGTEESTVIINEAAIEAMGLADPIGKWMQLFGMKRQIVGVVNDFHFQSMYETIKPMFLVCNPNHTRTIMIRIQSGREGQTLAEIERLYHRYNPGIPFEARFLNDEYNALYVSEQRVARLSKYFASITILISCLGLFGLAAFTAERRTKEIGIRKILGASEIGIVNLLSADFTKMILVAIAITLPFSYFLSSRWLESLPIT